VRTGIAYKCIIIIIIIIIIIERRDFGGIMSNDCKTPYKHKTKQYEYDTAERAKYLSDTDGGRAVGIRKASSEQFRLQLTPERRKSCM